MPPLQPTPENVYPRQIEPGPRRWQARLYSVIFGHQTRSGRWFDLALIALIGLSVLAVMLESVASVRAAFGDELRIAEWVFTILFTVEYVLRLACVERPSRYARSFFGVIDLLAILPTYLSVFFPGAQALAVVRMLRFLRVFRILKLVQYLSEANLLGQALWASRRKIMVFLLVVVTLDVIFGSLMYVVEGGENGFDSIPRSIYWAIVTLTTVGYGDISPGTSFGQAIAALIMIMGYAIIAVPTGIVTAEIASARVRSMARRCRRCGAGDHEAVAGYCRLCGELLPPVASAPEPAPLPDAPP
ncbi:MAG: ion transporter [Bacteroidota bacterium]